MNRLTYSNDDGFASYVVNSTKTPNYRQLIKLKQPLPFHPYFCESYVATDPKVLTYNGMRNCRDAGYPIRAFPSEWLDSGAAGVSWNDAFILLNNRMAMKSHQIEINLGETLGEWHQTYQTIRTAIRSINDAYKALKKKDLEGVTRALFGTHKDKSVRDLIKDPLQIDLAIKFGIKPVLEVVYDSMQKWETGLKRSNTRVVRCSLPPIDLPYSTSAFGYYFSGGSLSVSGRSIIHYGVENPIMADLQSLNLTNPAMVAYELMTLSFVLDWFVPIGKFIQCVAPPAGLRFIDGSMSMTAVGSGYYKVTIPPNGGLGWDSTMVFSEYTRKERRPLSSFPRYVFTFADYHDWSLSTSKIITMIELFVQRKLS